MLDIARHFYSPKVIKQYIDTIAKAGGTFLHLHLSGNENYALESLVLNQRAADAVRDSNGIYTNPKTGQPFLSFAQLQDIVQHAKAQGVELIPEIDSPAHMGGIFALLPPDQVQIIQSPVIANQIHYTEPRAIAFIQSLIGEVAGRFGDSSRHFHIGGDEFGYSVANHHEFVAYANQLSGYLKTLGLTPRMWNDGVIKSALPQFDSSIQITYWDYDGFMDNASADPAQIAARRAVRADMPELAEAGFDVLNYNSYYLYATPDSGNGATSEPGNFAERDILKNWHLGVWDSNNHANAMTDSSKIAGAALAIWGEHAGTLSDETVFRYTAGHLDAVIRKTNAAADSQLADTIAAESANGFYQLNQEAYLDFGHIADNAVVDLRYNGKQTLHLLQEELLSDHSALDIWVRADTRHDTRGDGVVLNRHWQKTAQTDSRGSGWEQENYTAYEYRGNKLWLDDDIVITWI
ncbi:family 20 glycosylhydrolase [Neisseria shayeganii]|uniref:Family 20 glycosylhydrolase n=2 Tax=Neisseria shayeganii TaxID=607712 RepID=A0A7D7S6G7_9NEIS|nr:family 20 glycosylhydrolase [Neisseria shayeganii]